MASTLTPEHLAVYFDCIEIPTLNLGLHYAKDAHIPLDLPSLFARRTKNGRGGYCVENGIFFNTVQRTLGFSSYLAGCTLSTSPHSPNSPAKSMMDVGFGGDMPIKPLPLELGPSTINIGKQEIRLSYAQQQTHPWNAAFCFTETEFVTQDLEVLNIHTSRDPRCFQTRMVLIVIFLREGDQVYGKGIW
ncbi:hypothetical protein IWZ03DRAFT_360150 [Phyllosticta citriasiana]|uniref:Arylamine N-acetyltransferase n=1 Tax=Phyllosticta citriasiana TaxID=595635 RepID=A0ABR1KK00_9PEZI